MKTRLLAGVVGIVAAASPAVANAEPPPGAVPGSVKVERVTFSGGNVVNEESFFADEVPALEQEKASALASTTTCQAAGRVVPHNGAVEARATISCSRPSIGGARIQAQVYSRPDRAWLMAAEDRRVSQPTPFRVLAVGGCSRGTPIRAWLKWNVVTPDGASGDRYETTATDFCG